MRDGYSSSLGYVMYLFYLSNLNFLVSFNNYLFLKRNVNSLFIEIVFLYLFCFGY